MSGRPSYPWSEGDALFASELNAAIANAGGVGGLDGAENVLAHGADPTGVADSTAAFRAAIATGKNVFAPSGAYLITGQLTLATDNAAQTLQGAGRSTVLLVDTRFDSAVTTGVIVLTTSNGRNDHQPAITDLTIRFVQPTDLIKSATAATAAGGTTVTLNDATGVAVGMIVLDSTNHNAIDTPTYHGGDGPLTTVTNIAGNVITLNRPVVAPGVASGDMIQFSSTRAMFRTLAAGGAAGSGGTGIQYPWAIYNSTGQTTLIRDVMIINAWNGVYVRGSSFQIARLDCFAFNVGLDVDECFNFPALTDYRFWQWGNPGGTNIDALASVYHDGTTVAANIGRTDGIAVNNFQSFCGILNLTAAFSWGLFTNVMLDGSGAVINNLSTGNGFARFTNIYTTKAPNDFSAALHVNTGATFQTTFDNAHIVTLGKTYPGVFLEQGCLLINDSFTWSGNANPVTMISVSGGRLVLRGVRFDQDPGFARTYIAATGTASLHLDNCEFVKTPVAGAVGLSAGAGNVVWQSDIAWNGWPNNAVTSSLGNYATDALAAAGGVQIGQDYRNGSVRMVRVT